MDRYLTFLYIRRGNAGVKSFRVHRGLAVSLSVVFAAMLITSVTLAVRYSGFMLDSRKLTELQRENDELTGNIRSFGAKIEELERRMEANLELQNQARVLAHLDPVPDDVMEVGIGGPGPEREMSRETGYEALLVSLEKDLDMLVRQSDLEVESYHEVIDILESEKKVRDSTPSIRPLKGGYLSSRFGRRMDPFTGRIARHLGVDYRARTGTAVMSTADGMVTMAKKKGSLGLVIEVNHGSGFRTRYAHLSRILVSRGQRVKRSEIIGLVGNTGRSTGSHLHYEVIFRKTHRNPLNYVIPEGVYFD